MKRVNIILVGFGRVGKTFLQIVHEKTEFCQKHYGLDLKLHSICEIDGALFSSETLDLSQVFWGIFFSIFTAGKSLLENRPSSSRSPELHRAWSAGRMYSL